jgi:hypothetical protein
MTAKGALLWIGWAVGDGGALRITRAAPRALGLPRDAGVHWLWIGTRAEYDRLVGA